MQPRTGARSPVEESCVRAVMEQAPRARQLEACKVSLPSLIQRILRPDFDSPPSNLHQRSNASVSSTGGGSFALCPQRCQPSEEEEEEEEEGEFLSELV